MLTSAIILLVTVVVECILCMEYKRQYMRVQRNQRNLAR